MQASAPPISVHASIHDIANPRSACAVLCHVCKTASMCSQASVPHAAHNITCIAPTSICDTTNTLRSAHIIPKSPSICFSIPENPQLASRSPHTPNTIRSRLRRPQSHPSHCASVCEHPQVQHPTPASTYAPSPRFVHFASPHDEAHSMQPSSNEQSVNHR